MALEGLSGVAAPVHPQVVTAKIARDVTLTSGCYVVIPGYGPDLWGPLSFPHAGSAPKAGEICLVAFDEHGNPTVIAGDWQKKPIARGTSLPPSPIDEQEYDYIASAANGVVWRLCYRAASASAYKWEFVGGAELASPYYTGPEPGTLSSATAFTFSAYEPGSSPTLTIPLAGQYDLLIEGVPVQRSVAEASSIYYAIVNSGLPSEKLTNGGFSYSTGIGVGYSQQTDWGRTILTAGTVIAPGIACSKKEVKIQVYGNLIRVRPVRVG